MECNDNHSTYFYEKYKECIHRGKGIYAHVGIIQIMERLITRGFKGKDGKTLDLDRKAGTNTIYALNAYKKSRKMTQNGICDAATWKDLIAI